MGEIARDSINYICVPKEYKSHLFTFCEWKELKLAESADVVWIKGFNNDDMEAKEVLMLPHVNRYYSKGEKIFPWSSKLPSGLVPSYLWTPIERALQLRLPAYNYNFFGVNDLLEISLKDNVDAEEGTAMIVSLSDLIEFMRSTPEVRLHNMSWCIIRDEDVLILGTPLLPINGKVFWRNENSFYPLGKGMEFTFLHDVVESTIDQASLKYVIWDENDSYFLVNKSDIIPLSRSSFNKTLR